MKKEKHHFTFFAEKWESWSENSVMCNENREIYRNQTGQFASSVLFYSLLLSPLKNSESIL